MERLFVPFWIVLGLVQFAAIVSGFIEMLGGFFGIIAAIILAEVPFVGNIMGIIGATQNWGWNIIPAVLLFAGVPIVFLLVSFMGSKS